MVISRGLCRWSLPIVLASVVAGSLTGHAAEPLEVVDVEKVWTGHPVGFSLLTDPPYQYVAYYDADRQMTVVQRRVDGDHWTFTKLPSHVGWDSHNYLTMALDRDGSLHLAGNMHCAPMMYFRTTRPHDAGSLQRVRYMVGPEREQFVTYPVFLRGPQGRLIFRYRDGRSGNGDDIYNGFNESKQQWTRLIDRPLTSGEGKMNAYCSRPKLGPDDRYHIVWVWRDTPDCATNHDLSYARSADLVHWETAGGRAFELPITIDSGAIVDPVPPHGGIINGGFRLGFDRQQRPIIAYHKYDAHGNTQIYIARHEDQRWNVRQISDWDGYRWDFQGGGSIPFEVRLGAVEQTESGVRIGCVYGRGRASWTVDEETLEPVDGSTRGATSERVTTQRAKARDKADSSNRSNISPDPRREPDLEVRFAGDVGTSDSASHYYQLRWYTMGPNRDRPRSGPAPPPAMLQVLKYAR